MKRVETITIAALVLFAAAARGEDVALMPAKGPKTPMAAAAAGPVECELQDLGYWGPDSAAKPWPCGFTYGIDVKGFPGCEELTAERTYGWVQISCSSVIAEALDNFRSQCSDAGGQLKRWGCGMNWDTLEGDTAFRCECNATTAPPGEATTTERKEIEKPQHVAAKRRAGGRK